MLGLAQASQYAGWWNQNQPLVINIAAPGLVSQSIYQNPAFSFQYGNVGNTLSSAKINTSGNIDLTGYSGLSGANNNRWVMATTFRMEWPSGLSSGGVDTTFNFFHQAKFLINSGVYASGFWALNQFTQLRAGGGLAVTSRIETDYGTQRVVHEFPGSYETYNNRWLTCVYSCAETPSVYTNYNSESGVTTGDYYTRACLYDTETGDLLDTADGRFNPTNGFSPFLSAPTTMPTNVTGSNGIEVLGSYYNGTTNAPIRISNMWGAFGTMFDPGNLPDTSIFTARPNNTIGNAKAWYNLCSTDYVDSGSDTYWVQATNQDLFSVSGNAAFELTGSSGNTAFTAGYSTTIIPKDQS
jgi:hypothetical protein